MSHKTMVNGTVYEIDGGKTLINGVAYSIDKGKTLVGGTAYEVGFAPSEATVTITGTGFGGIGRKSSVVTIDGVEYTSAATLIVPVGTVITCAVSSMTDNMTLGYIKLNGVVVLTAPTSSYSGVSYDYIVNGNVTINMSTNRNADKDRNGYIEITEQ